MKLTRIDGSVIAESDTMSIAELVVENRLNLQKADLRGVDLQGANLHMANLQKADLRGVDLQGANLQEANLQRTNLQKADLRGVDLRGADLLEANLHMADLYGANLTRADMENSAISLSCGSIGAKVDKTIALRVLLQFCGLDCDNKDIQSTQRSLVDIYYASPMWVYAKDLLPEYLWAPKISDLDELRDRAANEYLEGATKIMKISPWIYVEENCFGKVTYRKFVTEDELDMLCMEKILGYNYYEVESVKFHVFWIETHKNIL